MCGIRTSGLFLLLFLSQNTIADNSPWIFIPLLKSSSCTELKCDYNLKVSGNYNSWSLTSDPGKKSGECSTKTLINPLNVDVQLEGIDDNKLYFCAESENVWYHQGVDLFLESGDVISAEAR